MTEQKLNEVRVEAAIRAKNVMHGLGIFDPELVATGCKFFEAGFIAKAIDCEE